MMPTVVSISWEERPAWIFVTSGPAAWMRYGSKATTFVGRGPPGLFPSSRTFWMPWAMF
ncbi:hypothetical protein [Dialister hominis]|uniref:hypothetical protein n=1 Tax=Dialister hominis TaxID=2582419 RepID=UPI003FF008EF